MNAPFSLRMLRAAHRGTDITEDLIITAENAQGHVARGRVLRMGSLLTVLDLDTSHVVEDIRPEWVTAANVVLSRRPV